MERGDGFIQTGLSVGISKRLASVWEKYRSGLYLEGYMEPEVKRCLIWMWSMKILWKKVKLLFSIYFFYINFLVCSLLQVMSPACT